MDLPVDLYLLMLQGNLDPWRVLEEMHHHLLDECPHCAREWRRLAEEEPVDSLRDVDPRPRRARSGPPAGQLALPTLPADDDAVSLADCAAWKDLRHRMRAEVWKAREDVGRLLEVPAEERRDVIEGARTRFRSRTFAHHLLEESRLRVRSDPAEAAGLARLVPVALRWVPAGSRPWARSLLARAEAHRANAERVAGNLRAAADLFAALRQRMAREPAIDPAAGAEIDSLEASLCIGRRRFPEAERLLQRAVERARGTGARSVLRHALVQLGMVQCHRGRPEEALAALDVAAGEICPEDETYEHLCLLTCRVVALCDLEHYEEAENILAEAEPLFERQEHSGAYLDGLRGRVALGLERWGEAAARFRSAETRLLELGRDYDAALTVLYRAHAHLGAGDTAELRELAAGLVPTFQSRDVERETIAVLRLLAEAVTAERANVALVVELRRRLRSSRG